MRYSKFRAPGEDFEGLQTLNGLRPHVGFCISIRTNLVVWVHLVSTQLRAVRRFRLFVAWQRRRILLHEHNSGGRGGLRRGTLHHLRRRGNVLTRTHQRRSRLPVSLGGLRFSNVVDTVVAVIDLDDTLQLTSVFNNDTVVSGIISFRFLRPRDEGQCRSYCQRNTRTSA